MRAKARHCTRGEYNQLNSVVHGGRSDCRAGDDRAALGLAGVALKSGARSALATLWYINDQASGELVVNFHRGVQSGKLSKAHALQEAQRTLAADPRYAHPAYWAPFLLIGNWL